MYSYLIVVCYMKKKIVLSPIFFLFESSKKNSLFSYKYSKDVFIIATRSLLTKKLPRHCYKDRILKYRVLICIKTKGEKNKRINEKLTHSSLRLESKITYTAMFV